jgi:DNA-binding CsgD family transcriptional regulator/PAS domain-containing protein
VAYTEADFEGLIDLIYEAPLNFGLWPEVLHRISRAANAKGGLLLPAAAPTALLASTSADLADAAQAYLSGWHQYDFMREEAVERRRRGIVTQFDFLSQHAVDRHPYFQDFRRPYGMGGLICYITDAGLSSAVAIAFHLDYGKALLSTEERSRCDALCRHAARAIRVAAKLAGSVSLRAGLAEAMQSLTIGLAIVDASQRVVFANRRFESLDRRGVRIVNRRLVTEHPGQQAALERVLSGAFSRSRGVSPRNSIALSRSSPRSLLVQVIPLRVGEEKGFSAMVDRRLALIVATDPDDMLPTGEASLLALGLTAAEARVARLIGGGLSPAEAASQIGNAEATVRTLLKRVYSKAGLVRQSQLANLVARLTLVD